MATAEVKRFWSAVAGLGCAVCHTRHEVTIHHCHGGSCRGLRGMGLKPSDWLVIGLCVRHHTGAAGADSSMGIQTWEGMHGPQLLMLFRVALVLGINTFERAGESPDRLLSLSCCETSPRRPPAWALVG